MAGGTVDFPSNGNAGSGYLSALASGGGLGTCWSRMLTCYRGHVR
ncbi:MAG: hypothetical protein ABGY72_10870 [bacterium]